MHNQRKEFLSVLKKKAVRAKIEEFRPELPEFTLLFSALNLNYYHQLNEILILTIFVNLAKLLLLMLLG